MRETLIDSSLVKEYAMEAGASVVGIASAGDFQLAPDGFKPSDILDGCVCVIVLGAASSPEVLGNTVDYTASRNAMLTKMTDMAKKMAKRINAAGYRAKAISASGGRYVDGKHYGHLSLKHAAQLAGLGTITRNYLLTNPQYGNALWLSAVLTDAGLTADEKAQINICVNCAICVEACPSGALDNPEVFGAKKCSQYYVIENSKLEIKCFTCRTVCPYRFGT